MKFETRVVNSHDDTSSGSPVLDIQSSRSGWSQIFDNPPGALIGQLSRVLLSSFVFYISLAFSRVLRNSTTRFVGPSHFTFLLVFAVFGLTASARMIK